MEMAGNSFTAEVVAAFFIAALVEYPVEGEQEDDKLPDISASVLALLGMSLSVCCVCVPLYPHKLCIGRLFDLR